MFARVLAAPPKVLITTDHDLSRTYIRRSRRSHRRCSVRKGVLRNFAKFSGKHLCQSLFISCRPQAWNFMKKGTLAQLFSCEFCKTSKNILFIEHFWWLLLTFTGSLMVFTIAIKLKFLNTDLSLVHQAVL